MANPVSGVIYTIERLVEATVPAVGRMHPAHGGRLLWHRFSQGRDGLIGWHPVSTVGTGWSGLNQAFDGRNGIVYFVEPVVEAKAQLNWAGKVPASGGRLMWARHLGNEDGSFRWVGPRPVGTGWADFKQVFGADGGVIYAIENNIEGVRADRPGRTVVAGGKLVWYRHLGRDDGTSRWQGPHDIAAGWGDFTHVFAGGPNTIYAVKRNGDLVWYHHPGQATGAADLSAPHQVGRGWGIYEHVFYAGDGLIYGVEALQQSENAQLSHQGTGRSGGRLIRWHHKGMADGRFEWDGPTTMGALWAGWERAFADGATHPVHDHVSPGNRFCEFEDPPGSPTLGPRSYGVSTHDNVPRRMPLTWSLDANVSVSNIPAGGPPPFANAPNMWSVISQAFAIWRNSAGIPNALNFQYVGSSGGDIAFGVKDLGGVDATGNLKWGSTSPRGDRISFSVNAAVQFVPQTPAGGLLPGTVSLLGVAVHEIGHALGLLHNTNAASIMTAQAPAVQLEQLGADDVQSIRALYGWGAQQPVQGIGTDSSPVVCACGPWLVMAWKGIDPDDSIWTCRSTDGINWTPQRVVPGTGTADGPALAWDGNTLWLALRGIEDDDAVYSLTSGDLGENWSGLTPVPSAGSANGPAITIFNGSPLLVWRGIPGDTALYYNIWNNGWTTTRPIAGTGSTDRPSVCVDFNGLPRAVWRGIEGDDALYTAVFTGVWQPQEILQWIVLGNGGEGTTEIGVPGSLRGPSVTTVVRPTDQEVLLVWRGVDGDQGIYFTQGAPGVTGAGAVDWSTQAQIPGVGTTARPSITVFNGRIFMVWRGVLGDHTIYTAFN